MQTYCGLTMEFRVSNSFHVLRISNLKHKPFDRKPIQVLQESLNIPGTNVHLVYRSSSSSGYMSTLIIKMTGPVVPRDMAFVWLKIQIEGLKYEKQFEADPLLVYKFAWDRRNAYNQKVFGVVTAIGEFLETVFVVLCSQNLEVLMDVCWDEMGWDYITDEWVI